MVLMMKVCIGGTFNILHKGHKFLIDKAFEAAGDNGMVYIGVSVGELLKDKKFLTPYNSRVKSIMEYIVSKGNEHRVHIERVHSKYGLAVLSDYDAIIVSPETLKNAEEINNNRVKKGKTPLKIIEIPHILADDNKPISSTRIYDKEIDKNGKIL